MPAKRAFSSNLSNRIIQLVLQGRRNIGGHEEMSSQSFEDFPFSVLKIEQNLIELKSVLTKFKNVPAALYLLSRQVF